MSYTYVFIPISLPIPFSAKKKANFVLISVFPVAEFLNTAIKFVCTVYSRYSVSEKFL